MRQLKLFIYIYIMSAKDILHTSQKESMWEFFNILPDGEWLHRNIVVSARNELSLSRATTYRYIKLLKDKGLIVEVKRGTSKLTLDKNNENIINAYRQNAIPLFNREIEGRKTFVRKRY